MTAFSRRSSTSLNAAAAVYHACKLQDKNRYQTVYAKHEGSAYRSAAGLVIFTKELRSRVRDASAKIDVTPVHAHFAPSVR